jgi:ABC-type transport system substrate-binding protein
MSSKTSIYKKLSFAWIALIILSAYLFAFPAVKGQTNGPYLDKLEYLVVKSPDSQVAAMKLNDIDMYPGLIRPGDVESLAADGEQILYSPGGHMCYINFNLRNYTDVSPYGAGYPHAYNKRFLLDPWFRLAITYATPKAMIIGQIFKYIVTRIDSTVPPQMPKYHNPAVPKYDYDPGKAVQTLLDNGYFRIGSAPTWYWAYDAAGTDPLGDITCLSPSYEEAPTSYTIVKTVIDECRAIGLTNMGHLGMSFTTMLSSHVYPHQFDMFFLCWSGLGPDPDHLWGFFNSANDVFQGRNHPGLHDAQIDALTDIVHTSLDDDGEVVPAAMQVQALLADPTKPYGLCYIPIYSRIYYDAYQPDLEGMVVMPLTGSDNGWTYLNARWKPGTGHKGNAADNRLVYVLGTELGNLNPLASNSADEVTVWSNCYDALMAVDPYTLNDIYWLATYRNIGAFTGTAGGGLGYVDGMRFQYTIRSGLKWDDGEDFDTSDIKFALDYMAWAKPGLWVTAWEDYVGTNIISPTEVEVYYNLTSLWLKGTVETVACLLPPQVWSGVTDWSHFNLWQEEHTGHTIPGTTLTMKKLFGISAWYFYKYDPTSMLAELYPNPNYHKSQTEITDALANMFYWFGDVNKDATTDVSDLVRVGLGWGSTDPQPRYTTYKDADIVPAYTPDKTIDIEDARAVGYAFGKRRSY